MKRKILASLLVGLAASLAFAGHDDEKKAPAKTDGESMLKTLKEKVSYGIGMSIGTNLKKDAIEVDLAVLVKGMKDALAGSKPLLTETELRECMIAFQKDLQAKKAEKAQETGDKNKRAGEKFLAENKRKEGVKTTASGLQYKVLKAGAGKTPKATDTVTTHYKGTLIDGKVFDSSYDRNEPTSFPVGKVIKGWTEALQLMPVGSKWQLFIPSNLAYGEDGYGDDIGPHETLIFEIELISVSAK